MPSTTGEWFWAIVSPSILAIVGFVIWLLKRKIQRVGLSERLDIDSKQLETVTRYFEANSAAVAQGMVIKPPPALAELGISKAPLEEENEWLYRQLGRAVNWGIGESYSRSLILEGILKTHSDIEETVELARTTFATQFAETIEKTPQVLNHRSELSKNAMYAYYSWIQNPNEANAEAFHKSLEKLSHAIDSGELIVREQRPPLQQ